MVFAWTSRLFSAGLELKFPSTCVIAHLTMSTLSSIFSKNILFPRSSVLPHHQQKDYQPLPTVEENGQPDEEQAGRGEGNTNTKIMGGNGKISEARISILSGFSSLRYFTSFRSIIWPWWHILNTALILVGLLAIWRIATPSPTHLQEHILTDDGKSFPSGQLTWSQKFTPLPCGKSPAEAIARGCHFDIIATAWLPPKCIDYELASEFAALRPWHFFHDQNGTQPISNDPDTLGSQSGLIWTTNRWHVAHCLYMWKKLNRALVQGRQTDGEAIKKAHTDHCSMDILEIDTYDLDAMESILEVIYPPC